MHRFPVFPALGAGVMRSSLPGRCGPLTSVASLSAVIGPVGMGPSAFTPASGKGAAAGKGHKCRAYSRERHVEATNATHCDSRPGLQRRKHARWTDAACVEGGACVMCMLHDV